MPIIPQKSLNNLLAETNSVSYDAVKKVVLYKAAIRRVAVAT